MTETILKFHELERIYHYLNIASKKNDATLSKIKTNRDFMIRSKRPVCRITVTERDQSTASPHTVLAFLKECHKNQWDLDCDDTKHILDGDFDYVRNSNTAIPDDETEKIPGDNSS